MNMFFNYLFVSTADRKRNDLLKILFEKYVNEYNIETGLVSNDRIKVYLSELSTSLGINEKLLKQYVISMVYNEEVAYDRDGIDKREMLRICKNGLVAYSEHKYYLSGRKLRLDFVYDIFKIVSGLILLSIAIYTFIDRVHNTKEDTKGIIQKVSK